MVSFSLELNASSHPIDRFNTTSPVECYKLNILAVYCMILFALSLIFNSLLLWIFFRHKELRSNLNMLIIALTALNLFASCIEFPFVITSNLKCRLNILFIVIRFNYIQRSNLTNFVYIKMAFW